MNDGVFLAVDGQIPSIRAGFFIFTDTALRIHDVHDARSRRDGRR